MSSKKVHNQSSQEPSRASRRTDEHDHDGHDTEVILAARRLHGLSRRGQQHPTGSDHVETTATNDQISNDPEVIEAARTLMAFSQNPPPPPQPETASVQVDSTSRIQGQNGSQT